MIDGSERRNGWLNFELQSPHVIERRSNQSSKTVFTLFVQCSPYILAHHIKEPSKLAKQTLCAFAGGGGGGGYEPRKYPTQKSCTGHLPNAWLFEHYLGEKGGWGMTCNS